MRRDALAHVEALRRVEYEEVGVIPGRPQLDGATQGAHELPHAALQDVREGAGLFGAKSDCDAPLTLARPPARPKCPSPSATGDTAAPRRYWASPRELNPRASER